MTRFCNNLHQVRSKSKRFSFLCFVPCLFLFLTFVLYHVCFYFLHLCCTMFVFISYLCFVPCLFLFLTFVLHHVCFIFYLCVVRVCFVLPVCCIILLVVNTNFVIALFCTCVVVHCLFCVCCTCVVEHCLFCVFCTCVLCIVIKTNMVQNKGKK
jgi:hypothetical protein